MIVRMTHSNRHDYNKPNDSFTVFGRIIPKYDDGSWSYTEQLLDVPYLKHFDPDDIDTTYIDAPEKVVYLYYDQQDCIGRVRLRSNWNGYAVVEDIGVAKAWRSRNIGTALMEQAMKWARENHYAGLMLETQDVNVSACRFYAKHGFIIGAVDTMLFSNFPATAGEKAIFWYYPF